MRWGRPPVSVGGTSSCTGQVQVSDKSKLCTSMVTWSHGHRVTRTVSAPDCGCVCSNPMASLPQWIGIMGQVHPVSLSMALSRYFIMACIFILMPKKAPSSTRLEVGGAECGRPAPCCLPTALLNPQSVTTLTFLTFVFLFHVLHV